MSAELNWSGNLPHGCIDADIERAVPESPVCANCGERDGEHDDPTDTERHPRRLCERCAMVEGIDHLKEALRGLETVAKLASCRGKSELSGALYHTRDAARGTGCSAARWGSVVAVS